MTETNCPARKTEVDQPNRSTEIKENRSRGAFFSFMGVSLHTSGSSADFWLRRTGFAATRCLCGHLAHLVLRKEILIEMDYSPKESTSFFFCTGDVVERRLEESACAGYEM